MRSGWRGRCGLAGHIGCRCPFIGLSATNFGGYFAQRKADEPITAFLMNWRGETFYSRNTVKQLRENNALYTYTQQAGREWALVEHNRLRILEGAVGPDKKVSIIEKDLNNKFVLVTIE